MNLQEFLNEWEDESFARSDLPAEALEQLDQLGIEAMAGDLFDVMKVKLALRRGLNKADKKTVSGFRLPNVDIAKPPCGCVGWTASDRCPECGEQATMLSWRNGLWRIE